MPARLRLPPGVDDWTLPLADLLVVPLPGLGVDRLAHGPEHAQRAQVVLLDELVALAHQRAQRGRRGVELRDLVLVADVPEAARVGEGRHTLEHHRGRAVGERAVDDVAVPGDPADVRGAPEDVALVVVEHHLVGHRRVEQVAARAVHDALRLSRRAGGVEDEERVLRVHLLGGAVGVDLLLLLVEPVVQPVAPGDLLAGALHDEALHGIHVVEERLVDVVLEVRDPAAAGRPVGGDHHLRVAAVDPRAQRVGREAGEDDRVDGADPGAGEHRIGRLGDHRQVQDDAVAARHPQGLQHVRHPADVGVKLPIGDVLRLGLRRIVGLEDDGRLIAARLEMPVHAVRGDVERAVAEPFDRDVPGFERGVLHLGVGLDPVESLSLLAPEGVGIRDARCVHLLIGGPVDMRPALCLVAGRADALARRCGGGGILHVPSSHPRRAGRQFPRPRLQTSYRKGGGSVTRACFRRGPPVNLFATVVPHSKMLLRPSAKRQHFHALGMAVWKPFSPVYGVDSRPSAHGRTGGASPCRIRAEARWGPVSEASAEASGDRPGSPGCPVRSRCTPTRPLQDPPRAMPILRTPVAFAKAP